MLNLEINEIEFNKDKMKVWGTYEKKKGFVTTDRIIAHPSYLLKTGNEKMLKKVGTIVRVICIIDHFIDKTNERKSV